MLSRSRLAVLSGLTLLAGVSQAQTSFVLPHVLERDGLIAGIAWGVKGGQPIVSPYTDSQGKFINTFVPFDMLFALEGNDEILDWLIACANGKSEGRTYAMYSLQKGARSRFVISDLEPDTIEFPACDSDSKTPDGVRVRLRPRDLLQDGFAADAKFGNEMAKKQKMWLPSNFRLSIDGRHYRPGRTSYSKVTVKRGDLRLATPEVSDFSFTLGIVEAGPFEEGVQQTRAGKPTEHALALEYLDADGNPILRIAGSVIFVAAAPENIFLPRTDPDTMIEIHARWIGSVTIVK